MHTVIFHLQAGIPCPIFKQHQFGLALTPSGWGVNADNETGMGYPNPVFEENGTRDDQTNTDSPHEFRMRRRQREHAHQFTTTHSHNKSSICTSRPVIYPELDSSAIPKSLIDDPATIAHPQAQAKAHTDSWVGTRSLPSTLTVCSLPLFFLQCHYLSFVIKYNITVLIL